MHQYDEPSPESVTQVGTTRVPTAALTRALAEIEVRRARQAFEQAGTLTLAEALQESGVEATLEEVAEEIGRVRGADAAEAAKWRHRQRLRLILRAELASVLVCGLTLFSLARTVHDPQGQTLPHPYEMKNILSLTQGPHPQYAIYIVPRAVLNLGASGSLAVGPWSGSEAYPLSVLPDGYNVHQFEVLDDDGHPSYEGAPLTPITPPLFEFRKVPPQSRGETVSVFYNGIRYYRGWIRKAEVPDLLRGRPFLYYPEPVDDPQDNHDGLVPLTLPSQSVWEEQKATALESSKGYDFFSFAAGTPVPLDEHAWERF